MIVNVAFVLFAAFRCSPAADAFIMGREASCAVNFQAAKNFGYFAGGTQLNSLPTLAPPTSATNKPQKPQPTTPSRTSS